MVGKPSQQAIRSGLNARDAIVPAKAGTQYTSHRRYARGGTQRPQHLRCKVTWMPAFAGMTPTAGDASCPVDARGALTDRRARGPRTKSPAHTARLPEILQAAS
jgi:hypothetical protein